MSPYFIEGPANIAVSGGRTSGFMLRQILDAHGGTLPAGVFATFANTGLEDEATYRFLHDMQTRWNVPIHWLEWRLRGKVETVGFNSADRTGQWYAMVTRQKQMLPNPGQRFCSVKLKITAQSRFMRDQGFAEWTSVIGLRADEPRRVAKGRARVEAGDKDGGDAIWPLHAAGVVKADVQAFWRQQPFDLGLKSDAFGNCRVCFLKAVPLIFEVLLDDITAADPFIAMEAAMDQWGADHRPAVSTVVTDMFGSRQRGRGKMYNRFRKERQSYREMRDYVRDHQAAAQAEVDQYREDERRGVAQGDLLADCFCGVG